MVYIGPEKHLLSERVDDRLADVEELIGNETAIATIRTKEALKLAAQLRTGSLYRFGNSAVRSYPLLFRSLRDEAALIIGRRKRTPGDAPHEPVPVSKIHDA